MTSLAVITVETGTVYEAVRHGILVFKCLGSVPTSRLDYFLPTTKMYLRITKEKAQCGNYDYHKPFSQFTTLTYRWRVLERGLPWHREGEGFFFSFI